MQIQKVHDIGTNLQITLLLLSEIERTFLYISYELEYKIDEHKQI